MSYHTYAVYGTGLVLSDDELKKFIQSQRITNLAKTPVAQPYNVTMSPANFQEFFNETFETDICQYYDDSADSKIFTDIKGNTKEIETDMMVFNLKKLPSLFEKAYQNINEIIEELKKSHVTMFFPEDFDYEKNIGYFNCVTFS